MEKKRILIMGAAGRDFHNFNTFFRENDAYEVVAFTATQIPDIDGRVYPAQLAGDSYPNGIPIYSENDLDQLIVKHDIDQVVFAYSDVPHEYVMHKASQVIAAGADYVLMGWKNTMLASTKPVVSICAVRTGSGKSQTTRRVCDVLRSMGKQVVAIRHPMPYGDLVKQACQRFASYEDLDRYECTIEEREEYEPHIDRGVIVYAGVDYEQILRQAEQEADVIVWDGGNNDTPFYHPDVHIVLFDPFRAGHELTYHPGETNMRMAHIAVINKMDSAPPEGVEQILANLAAYAPEATVVKADSAVSVDRAELIKGKRVLLVEDGPTLTHGGMTFGAGTIAARTHGAGEMVDPRDKAVGSIKETFEKYPHIGPLLPAMGYSPEQIKDLETTINRVECDLVLFATPIDLPKLVTIEKPALRVRYEYKDHGEPTLKEALLKRLEGI